MKRLAKGYSSLFAGIALVKVGIKVTLWNGLPSIMRVTFRVFVLYILLLDWLMALGSI